MYQQKYKKYKQKYLELKQQIGGGDPRQLSIDIGNFTIGECVKELIEASYEIYNNIIRSGIKTTIIAGGQSPAYYCLAMMNFMIYNPNIANIIILPHSKGGTESQNQTEENRLYCERLQEKGIHPFQNVVIIDGVHHGVGILALESALKYCFPYIRVKKIAINYCKGVAEIPVDEEYALPCQPIFSDVFPRIVMPYRPEYFTNSRRFITAFLIGSANGVAEMIIDIARNYPETLVENTEWYRLNNRVTPEIQRERERIERERIERERIERERERIEREIERKREGLIFKPIIIENPKRYKCPKCSNSSGSALIITHNFDCPNKYKTPVE